MSDNTEKKEYATPHDFYGRLPLSQAIPLGLQHVLAMVSELMPMCCQLFLRLRDSYSEEVVSYRRRLLQSYSMSFFLRKRSRGNKRKSTRWPPRAFLLCLIIKTKNVNKISQ